MQKKEGVDSSQLFLVRLWMDTDQDERCAGGGGPEPAGIITGITVHGRVQHVLSGRVIPFDNWRALMQNLMELMPDPANVQQSEIFGAKGATDNERNT